METILKFFKNKKIDDINNNLISRTMLKIAVINRHFKGTKPNAGELWRCRIIKEINPGTSKGCFIVDPIAPISEKDILHLVPGFFYKKIIENRLIIIPKQKGHSWIMPLHHKRLMADEHKVYAAMVILDMADEDILDIEAENTERIQKLKERIGTAGKEESKEEQIEIVENKEENKEESL